VSEKAHARDLMSCGTTDFGAVQPGGKAIRYGAIVGENGQAWSGVATVGRKEEWPGWTPTEGEKRRLGPLPNYVEGVAHNPMRACALYLYASGKDTLYRIHGTNQPGWIGHAISSGCIRLTNEDVIDLYSRVKIGAAVVVLGPKQDGSRVASAAGSQKRPPPRTIPMGWTVWETQEIG
jgi:lipoprotein-anchoring transpeptidase ErfK/SrfK